MTSYAFARQGSWHVFDYNNHKLNLQEVHQLLYDAWFHNIDVNPDEKDNLFRWALIDVLVSFKLITSQGVCSHTLASCPSPHSITRCHYDSWFRIDASRTDVERSGCRHQTYNAAILSSLQCTDESRVFRT